VESISVRTRSRAWAKGKAWIDDGEIVLDKHHVEKEYGFDSPVESELMAFELASLSQQLGDERAVLQFVRRWGLLWHGADDLDNGECRESLKDWWLAAIGLNQAGVLYQIIMDSKRDGTIEPIRDFIRQNGGIGFPLLSPESEHFLTDYTYVASYYLERWINEGLTSRPPEGLQARISEQRCWWGLPAVGPGEFRITQYPSDLPSRAYSAFAVLMANNFEIRSCRVCGKAFRPKSKRGVACEDHQSTYRSWRKRGDPRAAESG
jgi:hypothetical protein